MPSADRRQIDRQREPSRALRLLKIAAIALGGLMLLAFVALYVGSEWQIRQRHDVRAVPLAVRADPALAAEGRRIATVLGCLDCHGPRAEGRVLLNDPAVGKLVAPGFAWAAPLYSDAALARLIRHGVRHDGTGIIVMPSRTYAHVADSDIAAIIAWIRTLHPTGQTVTDQTDFGPIGRALILSGKIPFQVSPGSVRSPVQRPADLGAYYYRAICSDCHALDRERPAHEGPRPAPALAPAAAAYDLSGFTHMLRTGKGMGNRDIGLMGAFARSAGPGYTDAEIAAIHAYLVRMAGR